MVRDFTLSFIENVGIVSRLVNAFNVDKSKLIHFAVIKAG